MIFTNKIIFLGLVLGFTNGFNTRRHDSEKKIEEIRDILLSVKTTAKNHKTRVKLLLDTWAPEALQNVSYRFWLMPSKFGTKVVYRKFPKVKYRKNRRLRFSGLGY